MLSDKDREWLEKREERGDYYCYHCTDGRLHFECLAAWDAPNNCPLEDAQDFRDAAEFEARVAAKLSRMDWEDVPCAHGMSLFCPKKGGPHINCGAWCLMREARLAVETEMEQEGK